jgi:polyisoprenyl-phosphate glycosyltransferase
MSKISIITPCFNEVDNVVAVYAAVRKEFQEEALQKHSYEHIFIDNASTDGTDQELRKLAASDSRVKVIFNAKNFGHLRSPHHALLECDGDAAIFFVCDLEDPAWVIPKLISEWEAGHKVVAAARTSRQESRLLYNTRLAYYRLLEKIADVKPIENFSGFGLYDRKFIETIRPLDDRFPYFRGLITELWGQPKVIYYDQDRRHAGETKNNLYTLLDLAFLGFTNYSKVPLRIITLSGFVLASFSVIAAFVYLVLKLVRWYDFSVGLAPVLISSLFIGAVQLIFLGVLGEYIGTIHAQVKKRPLVVERERLNF